MKLDIDFNAKEETTSLTFNCDVFKTERDFVVALSIVETFCADFSLDPEMDKSDITAILDRAKEMKSAEFTIYINDDGIEGFIPDPTQSEES